MSFKNGVVFLALLLIVPVVFVACNKSPEKKALEKYVEKGNGGTVKMDASQGKIQIQDKEGKTTITTGGAVEIPADFPKDILIYPNAKVLSSATAGDMFNLLLESQETIEKIASTYKEKMKAEGWKQTATFTMGSNVTMAYEKDKRNATVAVGHSEKGKTGIQLQVTAKR